MCRVCVVCTSCMACVCRVCVACVSCVCRVCVVCVCRVCVGVCVWEFCVCVVCAFVSVSLREHLFFVFYCVVLQCTCAVHYVVCLLVRHPHITYDYLHVKHLVTHARTYDSVVPAAIRDRGRFGYRCSIKCTGSAKPVIKNLMYFSWSLTDGRPFHLGALGPLDVI